MKTKAVASQSLNIKGCFNGFEGVYAVGWAFGSTSQPVDIAISVDGTIVAQGTADRPGPQLEEGHTHVHFQIPLPARFFSGQEHEVSAFAVMGGNRYAPLHGSLQKLGPGQIDGCFDLISEGAAKGWCCSRSLTANPQTVELYVDGVLHGQATANQPRADIALLGIHIGRSAFSIPLPKICSDGRPHTVEVRCQGLALGGSPKVYQADYEGFVEVLTTDRISGWVIEKTAPNTPVKLDVKLGGQTFMVEANRERGDLASRFETVFHGFLLNLPKSLREQDALSVTIKVHGTDMHLTEQPLLLYTERGYSSLKARMACAVLDALQTTTVGVKVNMSELFSMVGRASSLVEGQDIFRLQPGCALRLAPRKNYKPELLMAVVVDGGTADRLNPDTLVTALKEVGSLQNAPQVVMTGTHGPATDDLRSSLEAAGLACLTEEDFIRRHLAGPAESPVNLLIVQADCVPLPTIVLAWQRQLATDPLLASLSLMGWADAQAILPQRTDASGSEPAGSGKTVLDSERPRLAFLKRPRLDAVCLKGSSTALDLPPETTLADALIRWADAQSAKGALHGLSDLACLPVTGTLQPADFLSSEDHAAYLAMTDRIAERQMCADQRPTILHILHGLGGGIVTHCEDVAAITAEAGVRSLFVRSDNRQSVLLMDPVGNIARRIDVADGIDGLVEAARALNVRSVHLHHILGHSDELWTLNERLGVPLDITVHDYYWICPRVTLMDETERYCGEPALSACEKCVSFAGVYPGEDERYTEVGGTVSAWRRHHALRLESARSVFVPAADVLARMKRYYPSANLQILGHAEPVPSTVHTRRIANADRIGVAVIGGIGVHKGFEELIRLARWADKRNMPLQFHVIGSVPDPRRFNGLGNVAFHGSYARDRLPGILAAADCQIALFLSIWPETYCYTLSEALAAGLTPVGYDMGAIGDRIRAMEGGIAVPYPSSPEHLGDALLEAYRQRSSLSKAVPVHIGVSRDEYRDDYLRRIGVSGSL
ncbi:glycosyltransferase (plasmid) [Azospirillum melinis]|uniref:glycosyltransferase n=1 Tax=Azospirillum melinis TaxID=328839 RepID=UPI0037566E65